MVFPVLSFLMAYRVCCIRWRPVRDVHVIIGQNTHPIVCLEDVLDDAVGVGDVLTRTADGAVLDLVTLL